MKTIKKLHMKWVKLLEPKRNRYIIFTIMAALILNSARVTLAEIEDIWWWGLMAFIYIDAMFEGFNYIVRRKAISFIDIFLGEG